MLLEIASGDPEGYSEQPASSGSWSHSFEGGGRTGSGEAELTERDRCSAEGGEAAEAGVVLPPMTAISVL